MNNLKQRETKNKKIKDENKRKKKTISKIKEFED
jgi:hypothetical protein